MPRSSAGLPQLESCGWGSAMCCALQAALLSKSSPEAPTGQAGAFCIFRAGAKEKLLTPSHFYVIHATGERVRGVGIVPSLPGFAK